MSKPTIETEQWRDIPGFEGNYQVSNQGHIRSFMQKKHGKLKAFCRRKNGYFSVSLQVNKKTTSFLVHRIVALAFLGNPPDGYEVNHKDGDKSNNSLANIEYVSHWQNKQHAMSLPTHIAGERNGNSKLTENDVIEIRLALKKGAKLVDLSEQYHVNFRTISYIKLGKLWKHIAREALVND